jgi:hypothetical protein
MEFSFRCLKSLVVGPLLRRCSNRKIYFFVAA